MAGDLSNDARSHAELLAQVELFRGLDRLSLAKLSAYLESVSIRGGEILFRQGDQPDGLYLVTRGTFAIFAADGADGEVHFTRCGRGDSFGEIALLSGETRSASVRAEEDGELLRLERGKFLDLVRRDPSVSLAISAELIRRLRAADLARIGGAPQPDEISRTRTVARQPKRELRLQPRRVIGLTTAAVVVLAGWLLAPPSGLTPQGWHALVSLVALVPLLALDALPDGATSLLLVAIWVLGGIVPARSALSGFSTTTWILVVSMFAVGAAVAASGLLYRLALWSVARGTGFVGQVLTLGGAGLVLGAAVPNATGRISLVASAIAELAEALGYQPRSRAAAGLAMAAMVSFGQMAAPFLTSSSSTLVAFALLPETSKASLNWLVWAERAAPLHIILLAGLLAFIVWRFAPASTPSGPRAVAFALQRTLLGRPSRDELVAGLVTLALLVGFATQPLHGVDPAWVAVLAFVVMAGSGALTLDTLRAVNWNTVLLLGVLASMADVVSTSKLDVWLAGVTVSAVGGLGHQPALFVGVLALACLALSFVLRWQAAVPLIVIALSPVAQGAGIDPWVVAIVTLTASNTFFLPYQSTIYLALFTGSGSKLFTHAQARPVAIVYAILTVIGLVASVPIWHAMGLL